MNSPVAMATLASRVDAELPRLIDEHVTKVIAEIDVYRDGDVVPLDDLRRSVEHNMRFMVAALRDPDGTRDYAAPRETGRRGARQERR
ncbi:MAG: hypothetical protein GEV04_18950 [Actinophytocola sp.]|nr:hypothetical protein [Actinophytocola sp.]